MGFDSSGHLEGESKPTLHEVYFLVQVLITCEFCLQQTELCCYQSVNSLPKLVKCSQRLDPQAGNDTLMIQTADQSDTDA